MKIVFEEALEIVKECRQRLIRVQYSYEQTRDQIESKNQKAREMYAELMEQKRIDEIFQLLQDVRNLSRTVDQLMQKRNFRGAIEQLKFLDTMLHTQPLSSLPGLDDERTMAMQRLERCHRKIANQLEREY